MIVLKNLLIFAIFSFVGWIIELIYRSSVHKKLINPGFLTGCVVPLYGFGAVIINSICSIFSKFNSNYKLLLIIAISVSILTILELITGVLMLKIFNVKLWDYSNEKFNYKGMICSKFSLAWGALVLLFYLCIYPWLNNIVYIIINKNISLFFLGIFYGIFIIDFCISIDFFSKVLLYSKHIKKIVNLEKLKVDSIKKYSKKFFDKLYPYRNINKYIKDKIKRS